MYFLTEDENNDQVFNEKIINPYLNVNKKSNVESSAILLNQPYSHQVSIMKIVYKIFDSNFKFNPFTTILEWFKEKILLPILVK
jgi:hypothetical protein